MHPFQPLGDSGLRHTFPCSGLRASHLQTPCLPDPPPGGGACEFKANPREGRAGSNTDACRLGGHLLRSYYKGASSAQQLSEQTHCRPHSSTRFRQCRSKGSSFETWGGSETTSGHREKVLMDGQVGGPGRHEGHWAKLHLKSATRNTPPPGHRFASKTFQTPGGSQTQAAGIQGLAFLKVITAGP